MLAALYRTGGLFALLVAGCRLGPADPPEAREGLRESQQDLAVAGRLDRIEAVLEELRRSVEGLERGLKAAGGAAAPMGLDPAVVHAVEIGDSPVLGPADAAVTIVQFSDFECPFCASAVPIVERILYDYAGQVRWVFKHNPMPFHRRALPAHRAAVAAAAQGKFWEMHDRLFAAQERFDPASLEEHARALELDLDRFGADVASRDAVAEVQRDAGQARSLGVQGVPTFLINGRLLAGAQPYEVFRERVEAELARGAEGG
jgi:protein-disulfide isomerase